MTNLIICFLVSLYICAPLSATWGADTDIYVLDQTIQQVPPDVLIVLDLSGSMRWTPAGEYMYIASHQSCGSNVAYYPSSGTGHTKQCTINPYETVPKWGDATCSGPFYMSARTEGGVAYTTDCSRIEIAKRALRNILDVNNDNQINEADQATLSMRLGYMRFYDCSRCDRTPRDADCTTANYTNGCNQLIHPIDTNYNTIWNSISNAQGSGGTPLGRSLEEAKLYLDYHKNLDNAKNCRKKFVIFITDGADTLSCYGTGSEGQSDQYKRRRETVARAKALADAGYKVFILGFGGDLPLLLKNTLNWAAYYGGTDNRGVENSMSGSYLIPSAQLYPSGISQCSNSPTVERNGVRYATTNDPGWENITGYAYFAETPDQLEQALIAIKDYIYNLIAKSTSYVAPVVPISQMESYSSMNRMYMAMFKPTLNSLWLGNIKKFGIADYNDSRGNIRIGTIIDSKTPPIAVINAQNEILQDAKSYWSTSNDGGEVVKGGVGEKLASRDLVSNPRKIYTYVGIPSKKLLTESENAFTVGNANITYSLLGIPNDPVRREKIIKFAHGYDSYDWDRNGETNEKRKGYLTCDDHDNNPETPCIPGAQVDWILGAFIHSRPLVIHYANRSVIYAGANDGMLHAFDNGLRNGDTWTEGTGEELWAFIPPSLLPKLKDFESNNTLQWFVDGSPKAYVEKNSSGAVTKAIIIFGLRRGGDRYIALDVTNPDAPTLLWEIAPPTSSPLLGHEITGGFGRLGQTWSTPVIKQVADGDGKRVVAFFAGGYDPCNDPNMNCGSGDQKGNAIYAIDVLTGQILWQFSKTNDPRMTFAIPSDIGAFDINGDGKVDRLYVGDMGGQLWRFDIGNLNNTSAWTGKVIFSANASSSEKRKFFYPPEVSPGDGFQWVFIGSGDRENPKQKTGDPSFPTQNRLYAIKDKNLSSPMMESDLVDVTQNLLQDPNTPSNQKAAILNDLTTKNGWFVTLEHTGEKCLASPLIHSGVVFYTTFTPDFLGENNICELKEGRGRVYALQYKTGMAAFNYDLNNDIPGYPPIEIIQKSDRAMYIGGGIPSQIVLAIIKGEISGYIGVGGGVRAEDKIDPKSIKVLYWRTSN